MSIGAQKAIKIEKRVLVCMYERNFLCYIETISQPSHPKEITLNFTKEKNIKNNKERKNHSTEKMENKMIFLEIIAIFKCSYWEKKKMRV